MFQKAARGQTIRNRAVGAPLAKVNVERVKDRKNNELKTTYRGAQYNPSSLKKVA
jgi:hypothetical protein